MTNRRFLFSSALVVAASVSLVAVGAVPASAAPQDKVSGSGLIAVSETINIKLSVNAKGTPQDASGKVVFKGWNGSDFDPKLKLQGEVDCLSVEGNTAVLTGTLEREFDPGITSYFELVIVDKGKKKDAGDTWSFLRTQNAGSINCEEPNFGGGSPFEEADFTVTDS